MKNSLLSVLVFCFCVWNYACTSVVAADRSPNPVAQKLKLGYFNMTVVKAIHPQFDQAKYAEDGFERTVLVLLRDELNKLNAGKGASSEEEWRRTSYRQAVGLETMVEYRDVLTDEMIKMAVAQVAREHGLDVVVDRGAQYAGDKQLEENGEDITLAVLRTMPFTLKRSDGSSSGR